MCMSLSFERACGSVKGLAAARSLGSASGRGDILGATYNGREWTRAGRILGRKPHLSGAISETGVGTLSGMDPHPDLRLRTFPNRFEVWLTGWRQPVARGQALHDGSWMVAVRPVQTQPERAAIVANQAEAIEKIRLWCRKLAWTYRPNIGKAPAPGGMGSLLPSKVPHDPPEKSDSQGRSR